jgi:hypothetical protein
MVVTDFTWASQFLTQHQAAYLFLALCHSLPSTLCIQGPPMVLETENIHILSLLKQNSLQFTRLINVKIWSCSAQKLTSVQPILQDPLQFYLHIHLPLSQRQPRNGSATLTTICVQKRSLTLLAYALPFYHSSNSWSCVILHNYTSLDDKHNDTHLPTSPCTCFNVTSVRNSLDSISTLSWWRCLQLLKTLV